MCVCVYIYVCGERYRERQTVIVPLLQDGTALTHSFHRYIIGSEIIKIYSKLCELQGKFLS